MKEFISNLKFVWKYGSEKKGTLILMVIVNILSISINIILPILGAKIIVELTNSSFNRLLFIALIFFMISCIRNIFSCIIRRCGFSLQKCILNNLQVDLANNILMLDNKTLDDNGSGTFISRLTGDTFTISDSFNYIINSLSEFIKYIGFLVAMFIINRIIFIFVVVYLILLYYFDNYRTSLKKKDKKLVKVANDKIYAFIGELVRGSRI